MVESYLQAMGKPLTSNSSVYKHALYHA